MQLFVNISNIPTLKHIKHVFILTYVWLAVPSVCMLAEDANVHTLLSVFTPTVSRKLTTLRSRMMTLGSDGSGL